MMEEPDEVTLGESGWVKYVENKQGLTLCRYFWPAQGKPKAVLLSVHGHSVHAPFEFLKLQAPGEQQKYDGSWVERNNKKGISVCALDNQSHGRSEGSRGLRCYADKFDDYVQDVIEFARYLKESKDEAGFSNLPVFILGISLGGCIATNAIHEQGDLFKGAILLAPMLSLEKISKQGLNPYLRPLASLMSGVLPTLPVAEVKKNLMFPEVQEAFDKDPHCWHKMTRARLASEFLKTTEKTCKSFKDMKFPFIVMHGVKDDMCDPDGSKQLYEFSQAEDKTLKMLDNMWHFLLKEPGNEELQDITIEWIMKRL